MVEMAGYVFNHFSFLAAASVWHDEQYQGFGMVGCWVGRVKNDDVDRFTPSVFPTPLWALAEFLSPAIWEVFSLSEQSYN